jgi:dTDP-glucose 4,6-dehydratase
MSTVLVTGGAGFIGCNLVNLLLRKTKSRVVVFDKLSYAGNLLNLRRVEDNPRYTFIRGDITNRRDVEMVIERLQPDAIIHLAAETHVDRSIDGPRHFLEVNVMGTFELLYAAWRFWSQTAGAQRLNFRFIHVSTDEVYGSLAGDGQFSETHPYAPNSPYAASKASADHFVRAYYETFDMPTIITNCSNNYGFYQYPEKLIPLTIVRALAGQPIPIYGTGENVRDWLFVEDHCAALINVLERGRVGEKYNIGGRCERSNIEVVDTVCAVLEELAPARSNPALTARGLYEYRQLKTLVPDRPGHDRRYAIDCDKLTRELGWSPTTRFEDGMRRTVNWYLANSEWSRLVQRDSQQAHRAELPNDTVPAAGWNWRTTADKAAPDHGQQ